MCVCVCEMHYGVCVVCALQGLWGSVQGSPVEPFQSAICGALAGGCAAAVTTPLDVAKTRIMLAMVSCVGR